MRTGAREAGSNPSSYASYLILGICFVGSVGYFPSHACERGLCVSASAVASGDRNKNGCVAMRAKLAGEMALSI